jgi:hypothetical protein
MTDAARVNRNAGLAIPNKTGVTFARCTIWLRSACCIVITGFPVFLVIGFLAAIDQLTFWNRCSIAALLLANCFVACSTLTLALIGSQKNAVGFVRTIMELELFASVDRGTRNTSSRVAGVAYTLGQKLTEVSAISILMAASIIDVANFFELITADTITTEPWFAVTLRLARANDCAKGIGRAATIFERALVEPLAFLPVASKATIASTECLPSITM